MNMNMKKMRGAVDPLTLGWILTAVFTVLATVNVNNNDQRKQVQQEQAAAQQAAYQQKENASATVIPAVYKAAE